LRSFERGIDALHAAGPLHYLIGGVSLTSKAAIGALDDDSVRCEGNFAVAGALHNLGGDRRLATATSHRSSAAAPSF
jgi:hypothetical protein